MSNEDVYEEYILDNDPRYLDIIALKNKPYIKVLAKKIALVQTSFPSSIVEIDDLEQEGFLGFREGLDKYKKDSGNKILTYCKWWADKRMKQHLASFENTVYHPDWVRRWSLYGNIAKSVKQTQYHLMVVDAYKDNIEPMPETNTEIGYDTFISKSEYLKKQNCEIVINEDDYESFGSVEYDYLRLIISQFSEIEIAIIDNIWIDPNKAFKNNKKTKELFSKIQDIYLTLKKQASFVLALERNGEYVMDMGTYRFWVKDGVCGDKKYKYEAKSIYKIESTRLGISVVKSSDNFVILKTNN